MGIVTDRTSEPNKSRASRARVIERSRQAAKDAINRSIEKGGMTDIGKGGVDVIVPKGDLSEPSFRHGKGGINHGVMPGNNNPNARHGVGDQVPRPPDGSTRGRGGSPDGEGEDDFGYTLSEEEVLDIIYQDLGLDVFKQGGEDVKNPELEIAGYAHVGPYNRLSLLDSKQEKIIREGMMTRKVNANILALLDEVKTILLQYSKVPVIQEPLLKPKPTKGNVRSAQAEVFELEKFFLVSTTALEQERIATIQSEIGRLENRRRVLSKWQESNDLVYRTIEELPKPRSKVAMFCEMDVSGSMDEERKSNAKLFFYLLYHFLKRNYEQVDVVYIRHHSTAREVDEVEFFGAKDSGGTVVSTAHELLLSIQAARYPEKEWDIFAAQASDGDNSTNDISKTTGLMRKILSFVNGFFYVQIANMDNPEVWQSYEPLLKEFPNRLWMQKAENRKAILPVFHDLFQRRGVSVPSMRAKAAAFNL